MRHRARVLAVLAASGLMVLAGAWSGPGAAQAAEPVAGAWRIEQARSAPILDKRKARLDFGAEGRLSGHTSCNDISASYSLNGQSLQIGPITTTRKACMEFLLEQEDRILTALELASSAAVRSDGLLELRDAQGRGLLRATRWGAGP